MKKQMLYITLFAATLFACGSDNSNGETSDTKETVSESLKVELSFNMPEKDVEQLSNATGELVERYGASCFVFEGDNGKLEVYISSTDLKTQEYLVNVEDLNAANALASYTIKSDEKSSYCCGKMNEIKSIGSITITAINDGMISGNIDVDNYDGSTIKGSFSILK